ncbi:uncharacterized protein LOC132637084 [Lycium barbarum]|uniref:uncharacterized protein LOC132637084 n=1 Tax=Lycium barbarum TaxID=112863 RepID=UPI00293F03C6|nr:uncharacterized protein LOC132637084 [Lycium barbarum]
MANLPVYIHYNGYWNVDNNFVEYQVDGILIRTDIKFEDFVATISKQLSVDVEINSLEIHYKVDENSPPMSIHNDMGLLVYIEMKKITQDFGKYPLCITVKVNDISSDDMELDIHEFSDCDTVPLIDGDPVSQTIIKGRLYKSNIFKLRKLNDKDTCSRKERLLTQRMATSNVIGSLIVDKFVDPKTVYTPRDIAKDMKKQYGIDISYSKAHRSKKKALESLGGNASESYGKLPKYLFMLMHSNPGLVVSLSKTDEGHFMYTFVALYASIKGWEYCRPIVVVDGSFLKASHRGTFLIASTQDAAGKILPLAYGIVDSENDASWKWFFERFKEAFGQREQMCIVSDRNESIKKAVFEVYPDIPHCCMWHLWNNIKGNFRKNKKRSREIFFAMARAYTVEEFNYYMSEMERIDKRVKDYLFNVGYHRWCRAHATCIRTMTMTSNIAECVNSVTKEARNLPVMRLLEETRNLVQKWNFENMKLAQATFKKITEKYESMVDENYEASQYMTVTPSNDYLHTVTGSGNVFIVCIRERTCSCGRFQLDQVPCPHAMAVLNLKGLDGEEYCSLYYTNEYMAKTYEILVNPLPHEKMWKVPTDVLEQVVLPPIGKKNPGRPKVSRYKSAWETNIKKFKTTWGKCGHEGHNRRTCKKMPKKGVSKFVSCVVKFLFANLCYEKRLFVLLKIVVVFIS